jgi:dipeptidyl-peptidase 4
MRSILRALAITALITLPFAVIAPLSAQQLPQTWQEQQDFRSGPTPFEPLMEFWYELDRVSDIVSMRPLTRTLLDREVMLVTIAEPMITTPEDAIRSGKTIVLLAPSVHGGEVSPKESVQLVAKELVGGDMRALLEDVIVIALPLVNPDGGEVRRRTNEAGYDMNRDYVKLESQEIHALVTQVMNEWTPDIHVDGHHGGSAPYVMTYQGTLNPAADAELRAFPYEHIFPRIQEAVQLEDYAAFDYSGAQTRDGVRGWGSTSVEPRKHHVYTGLTNSVGILLETPSNTHRVMRDGTIQAIPEEERYFHQIRGGVIATSMIIRVAAERREELRALTTASRMRAIEHGTNLTNPVVLDYELTSRGTESVWMPDSVAPMGYTLENVPVWLEWQPTRTTTRPAGYLLPPAMAAVVPLLQDHDIAVYRFREPTTLDTEVYYATEVRTDSYFQGHYLKAVEVEKESERLEVVPGWFWIPTAQSRGNLITYIFEPETDDNLITWGWTDHILQEGEEDRQRVPMIRVPQFQPLSAVLVQPFNLYQRNRFFRPN